MTIPSLHATEPDASDLGLEDRRNEAPRRDDDDALRTIADALPILISYVDAQQRYRFVNAAYQRWFGRPIAGIVGSHVREVLGDETYLRALPYIRTALVGEQVTFEIATGERIVEASYIPDVSAAGEVRGFVAMVSDIRGRKQLEERRAERARRSDRLAAITAAIADAVAPQEIDEAVVDRVAAALGASSAGLWLLDASGRTARMRRAVGYPEGARRQLQAVPIEAAPALPILDSIRRAEPLWIESQAHLLRDYPHLAAMVTRDRSYCVACLPLVVQGRTLGALGLTFDDAPAPDAEERKFLLLVARHTGQALERVRLLEAERDSRKKAEASAVRLGLLSRASRAFSELATDTPALLQAIVEQATADLADGSAIVLVADDALELAAVHCRDPATSAGLRGLLQRAPLRLNEGISDGGLIAVPLRSRGTVIGAFAALRQEPREPFTAEDKGLVEELAERAALAIEAGRLHNDNQQARARAELLYGLAAAANSAERIEQVFDVALDGIERALGASRSSILIFDREGVMRFRSWRGLSEEYRGAVEGHSPWKKETRAAEPILVPDARRDEAMSPYRALFDREGIGALAFVPLLASGRLVGKFMVYYDRPRTLLRQELETAKAIANLVASAIARFEMIAELRETVRYNELFAGILGHDLRNPLGAMLMSAELTLRRAEGDGEKTRHLSRIISSGKRMARMVDQLLDFTRARVGGGFGLQPRASHLGELCRQVVEELEIANPEWTLRLEETGDLRGTWDPDRLTQVASNLIANAGQHGTRDGEIRVRLDGSRPDQVVLQVQNSGSIPESLRSSLFDPFRRVRDRADTGRGLGLGLFISRELVVSHGGSVDVSSPEAEGTTFTVRLPRHSPVARRADAR